MSKRGWKKKAGRYDLIDTLEDLRNYMKRLKSFHMVILSNSFINKYKPRCVKCGKTIKTEDGNRTHIYKGKVLPLHYNCAWNVIFENINRLSDAYNRGVFDIEKGKIKKLPKSMLE